MANYIQSSFRGGLNQFVDPTRINKNEYPLLINGRVRFDVVEPLAKPVQQTFGLPAGNYQGIYTAGNYMLAFVSGVAYYKDFSIDGAQFQPITNWTLMNVDAVTIYAVAVASSTSNFTRDLVDAGDKSAGVKFTNPINGSPICVVVQDGTSQPQLIIGTNARQANTFAQWTVNDREYVPVGNQMLFSDGRLYIISVDGTQIYRSVTGRPLDFVVNVDVNGDKGGDANTISHTVGFSVINGIHSTNSTDASIFVSTINGSFLVTPDFTTTLFGEPLFVNTTLFSTGVQNQFSFANVLGDAVFIDVEGIKSFNAVQQFKITGKNAPFSAQINKLFRNLTVPQPVTNCCIVENDYAYFSVNTVYGNAIVVYDTIYQKFVCVDLLATIGAGLIKQFTKIELDGVHRLFFITTDNKLWEYEASTTEVETCSILIGEFCTQDPKTEQRLTNLRTVFIDAEEDGTVFASIYADRVSVSDSPLRQDIKNSSAAPVLPLVPPFGTTSANDNVKNLTYYFNDIAFNCWKVAAWISWSFKAKLSHVKFESSDIVLQNNIEQSSQSFAANVEGNAIIRAFSPLTGPVTTVVAITGINMLDIESMYIGDVAITDFQVLNKSTVRAVIPVGAITGLLKIVKANSNSYSTSNFVVK